MYKNIIIQYIKIDTKLTLSEFHSITRITKPHVLQSLPCQAKSLQSCPTLCNLIRLLCPWDSPGKNNGVCCHFLPQFCSPWGHKRSDMAG